MFMLFLTDVRFRKEDEFMLISFHHDDADNVLVDDKTKAGSTIYNADLRFDSEILNMYLKIRNKVFGKKIEIKKILHKEYTGPYCGFSLEYDTDDFKLTENFSTEPNKRVCCDFALTNKTTNAFLHTVIAVPEHAQNYVAEALNLRLEKCGEYSLLPVNTYYSEINALDAIKVIRKIINSNLY